MNPEVFDEAPPTKKARIQICDNNKTGDYPIPMDPHQNAQKNDDVLDTNLYSRQIYALGESAMMHLRKSSVLISGMGGVGVEIAKNLILGGVRRVTIQDTKDATYLDLSAQYYLGESHIGKNRAASSLSSLAELNDSVEVSVSTEPLTEEFVAGFELVILTDTPFEQQFLVNSWTRNNGRYLLVADARGLFSYVAVDVGKEFRIDDKNGEQSPEGHVEFISKVDGDVGLIENAPHNLEDGDYVTFSEVKGMTELNDCKPLKVTVKKPHIFCLGDAVKDFNEHLEGGRFRQVKMPTFVSYPTLEEGHEKPEMVMWDMGKWDYGEQLHELWAALYAFEKKHGRSPVPRNAGDVDLLRQLLRGKATIAEDLLKNFTFQARGNLVTVASVLGGIASQEAVKIITHHMTPLNQFMYLDHIEALPAPGTGLDTENLTEADCAPRNSRYDGQAAVFGWKYQEELMKQKWFIVGAGAIGCELLKNFAMMGVGCDPQGKGKLKITDMDQIEISNLNRQFLFRRGDVGSKKSECAGRAAKKFNPDLNIEVLSERVAEDTEHIFSDEFFGDLNGVANALDNVEARRYMDRRCVFYQLPLLESGTQGTKGNTQVVFPHLTESYGSSVDPPEKDIPMCTLKSFPYEIQHTIQWARDCFEGVFTNGATAANQYLDNKDAFFERMQTMAPGQKVEVLETVHKALITERSKSAEDCIRWARLLFESNYHNSIAQLLYSIPADQVTNDGVKFWSGTKRCPHVLSFDVDQAVKAVKVPEFKPSSGVKVATTEAEAANNTSSFGEDSDDIIKKLTEELTALTTEQAKPLVPIDFEKDDDSNHHMEFITAASNLRAENYNIQPADMMKTKKIAGRIIPALATTTATVAGLVSIELYKMIDVDGKLPKINRDRFKNAFINLALPFFGLSEPMPAPAKNYNETKFTLWDRLDLKGPMTLSSVVKTVQEMTGMTVSMLSAGTSLIYADFMPGPYAKRKDMNIKEVVEQVTKRPLPSYKKSIVLEATMEGDDEEIPYIRYVF
uniref:E1 ubiquitin-activating enzyme n=1 Tax=Steinernema glaseri TaxID=37863 RepID=A0A1I7YJJ1_9BILA